MDYGRELVKGNVQTLVLAVLGGGPRHGYGVAREIERRSGDALSFGEGSLYPALHALERAGLIRGAWEGGAGGPARKVYALTGAGETELARRRRTWEDFVGAVNSVLGGGLGDAPEPA